MLRQVQCPPSQSLLQAREGEFVVKGTANDITQKIKFDGLDDDGQPINPRVIDKTPEEIEADNLTPPKISQEQKPAQITNAQWEDVRDKLVALWANKDEVGE